MNADIHDVPDTGELAAVQAMLAAQPHAIVERDGVRYTLLGTAHVSRASVDAVRVAIANGGFDAIAVELDPMRHGNLIDPDKLRELDLVRILREGKTAMFAANLVLAAYQRRLAEKLDIEPGAELKAAAQAAVERGLPLLLIDREVGITFRRAMSGLGWWDRAKLGTGLVVSLFGDEEVDEAEIEQLKEGDMLESSFGEFARENAPLYNALIAERDRYMAARLREDSIVRQAGDGQMPEVLVVIGAGHLKGLTEQLRGSSDLPAVVRTELEALPKRNRIPWFTLALAIFVFSSFSWAYLHGGTHLGNTLVLEWILWTGIGGALGCIAAGGHPLSVLGAFVWSPLKPLHPGIPSGLVSGLIQAWARKPTYDDFLALRDDVTTLRGWYRNRVSRVLLNVILTSVGTATGVIIASVRLIGKLG
jgi:pheromone shutdown-related protein TraB